MSIHSNQARQGGPSSTRGPAGSNPSYKTHVQQDSKKKSSTSPAGGNKRERDLSVDGAHRTTSLTVKKNVASTNANVAGQGDGHYTPKG